MASEYDFRQIYENCYKGTELINIAASFEELKEELKSSEFAKLSLENKDKKLFASLLGDEVDEEKLDILADYCSIDKLTVPGELKPTTKAHYEWTKDPEDPTILNNIDLQTVTDTIARNKCKHYQANTKYRSERPIDYEPEPVGDSPRLIPESDILVYIRVYKPFSSRYRQTTDLIGKLSVNYVIALHGSQTLDKLRDAIQCTSDFSVSTEMSENPSKYAFAKNAKDVYKSGFFFIENVFYNDFRDPNNHDNSQVIRDWMEARKFAPSASAKMEDTRIDSLTLRFGFPYVYQHQGDCEHLIAFSDARLVNATTDELNADSYPRIVRIKPKPTRFCMTCGIYTASWITTSSSRVPHNPCMFCDSCFKSYNYKDGKKVGSFEAYPYPYDASLLNLQDTKRKRDKSQK